MTDQKREYWSNLIAEQEASGQTIRAFCQKQGVGDNSFYYWRKKLQPESGVKTSIRAIEPPSL
jgi:transposase-like protein